MTNPCGTGKRMPLQPWDFGPRQVRKSSMSDTANNGQPRHDRGAQFEAGAATATPPAQVFAGLVIACRTAWSMAAAPLFGMRASDVLITGQEVAFSTGAAAAPRRQGTGHRLLAGLWRVLAWWPNESHRRPYSPPYHSSAPACPVRSTVYERGGQTSARPTIRPMTNPCGTGEGRLRDSRKHIERKEQRCESLQRRNTVQPRYCASRSARFRSRSGAKSLSR
jgi:hypothetical protein